MLIIFFRWCVLNAWNMRGFRTDFFNCHWDFLDLWRFIYFIFCCCFFALFYCPWVLLGVSLTKYVVAYLICYIWQDLNNGFFFKCCCITTSFGENIHSKLIFHTLFLFVYLVVTDRYLSTNSMDEQKKITLYLR